MSTSRVWRKVWRTWRAQRQRLHRLPEDGTEDKNIDGVWWPPRHWHAMLSIMACAAGKDVYVEKPLTVFIDEGKWMLQARTSTSESSL